jgi:hypothetical protein
MKSIDVYVVKTGGIINKGLRQTVEHLKNEKILREEPKLIEIEKPDEYSPELTSVYRKELSINLSFDNEKKPLILNGSGMLHHLTYVFTKNLKTNNNKKYSMLFLDKHNDGYLNDCPRMMTPLRCSLFVLETMVDCPRIYKFVWLSEENKRLFIAKKGGKKRKTIEKDADYIGGEYKKKIISLIDKKLTKQVYVSLDLDFLSPTCVETDYDQGTMKLPFLLNILKETSKNHKIIGADICGLKRYGVGKESIKTYSKIFTTLVDCMGN